MAAIVQMLRHRAGVFRRFVGGALCVAGGLMVAYAVSRYAIGIYRADAARQAWEERQAAAQVALTRTRALGQVGQERVAVGAPVARLLIPRIGMDEIVLEGVGGAELNAGPGHLPGSAFPGQPGNAVLSAHRDRPFDSLDAVQLGHTIVTETGHSSVSWIVVRRRIVGRATPALFQTKGPTLTLTTCWPIRYLGTAPDRLIVTALPISSASRKS